MSKDELTFSSDFEFAKPSQVIFSMLERAIREGRLGIERGHIWSKNEPPYNINNEVDAYIQRLVDEASYVTSK